MLIWEQITSDAKISVGIMPLEVALVTALKDWKFHVPVPLPLTLFDVDVLKLLSLPSVSVYTVLNLLLHQSVGSSGDEIYSTGKHIIYLLNVTFNNSTQRVFLKNWSSDLLKYISNEQFVG